jgi:putative ABC transport system substrate-binding protein
MRRREFLGLAGVAAAWPLPILAQQSRRLPRIGYVDGQTPSAWTEGLLRGLRELGYVDGQNISLLKESFSAPSLKDVREAISRLLPNIDILVVTGTIGGVAAKAVAPATMPVVFVSVGAPVDIGLVESLSHPGGNMTGITFEATSETYAKRLQILKEIMPGLSSVAVMGAKDDSNVPFAMQSLNRSAPALQIAITPIGLNSPDDLGRAFDEIRQKRLEALLVVAGSLTYGSSKAIADLALADHLPSCHAFKEAAVAGGLVSLGPDLVALAHQSAHLIDKIIKGERPAELPVEQPAQYVMYVNLRTAKALGLTLPLPLLARADEVIE